MIYDVFVSYRRIGGFEAAKYLNDWLTGEGYTVSFDIDTLREGDFDTALLSRIEQCTDFILVVDEHCFDKTLDHSVKREQDWLRIELAYALQLKRNIIPVLLAKAKFPDGLPDDIKDVPRKNGPTYSYEYYNSFKDRLKSMLHSLPRNKFGAKGIGDEKEQKYSFLKVLSDMDCVMAIDGEECELLSSGQLKKIPLSAGEYLLQFVSTENDSDCINVEFEMPEKDKLFKVDLQSVKRMRLEQERKEREARGEFEVDGVVQDGEGGGRYVHDGCDGGTGQ